MSHVHVSFEMPEYVANTDGIGVLRILESVLIIGSCDKTKVYQASTSELYKKSTRDTSVRNNPFDPRSPYAITSCMHMGLQLIIVRRITFLLVMVFYLIMNPP